MADFSKIYMMNRVPERLGLWWDTLKVDKDAEAEITAVMGNLPSLIEIEPDRNLVQALITFWDPARAVFKFKDFELTPTLAEISGFTALGCCGLEMLLPSGQSGKSFQTFLGLQRSDKIRSIGQGWVTLDYLYERFGRPDGHDNFKREFSCSKNTWQKKCKIAFMVALLGTLVFPVERGKIRTILGPVVKKMIEGIGNKGITMITIVPTILAEMYRALTKCARGAKHFDGCNLLLQIWASRHIHKQKSFWEERSNKIAIHKSWIKYRVTPKCYLGWIEYLTNLTDKDITWTFFWVPMRDAVFRTEKRYYLELIGLTGTHPYAPLRVLRQFGIKQVIPLHTDMSMSMVECQTEPELKIPRAEEILIDWKRLRARVANQNEDTCTPEYSIWIRQDAEFGYSRPGKDGFEDKATTDYIYFRQNAPPDALAQMGNILALVGAGSSIGSASTSHHPPA